jgi:hypothetical protein
MAGQDEELLRSEYERCHPDDTFDGLKSRAAFSKEDRLLLREWRAAIRARLATAPA